MRRRHFKSAQLQLAYDRHLNTGDPKGGQGVSGEAFRRGYARMRNLWPRGSLGYVAWAAGKDRRTADMISAAEPLKIDGKVVQIGERYGLGGRQISADAGIYERTR